MHVLEDEPNDRRALVQAIIAQFYARQATRPPPPALLPPAPAEPAAALPDPTRAGGRMSATQFARVHACVRRYVVAEHGEVQS